MGQGKVDNTYPIFEVLSLGTTKFWTSAIRFTFIKVPTFAASKIATNGGVKITVATMRKSRRNAFFGHTVIGIGNKFYHQGITNGKPVLKLISSKAELDLYTASLDRKKYIVQTFTAPQRNADAASSYIGSILGKSQNYSIIPGCGQNCASNGADILTKLGVPIPKTILTPRQLNNYIVSLKEAGLLID